MIRGRSGYELQPRPFRRPGLALLAILAMAVGIAAFSASVVAGRAFIPVLPVDDPDRVVQLARLRPNGEMTPVAAGEVRAIGRHSTSLDAVGGFNTLRVHLTGGEGAPLQVQAAVTTAGVFDALRVAPLLGRGLRPEDEALGAEPVLLLGHDLWLRRFGGVDDVLGRRIDVNGRSTTVIGVMPRGFTFPLREELWLPLPPAPTGDAEAEGSALLLGIGRLAEGRSVESAQAELAGLVDLRQGEPEEGVVTVRGWVEMLRDGDPEADAIPAAFVIAFLVLVVACANVALLFLVGALNAERRTAVRLVLGARRGAIVVERLLETLVLAGIAGVLSLGLIHVWTRFMRGIIGRPEYGQLFQTDWAVFVATALMVVVAALIAGLVPAMRGTDLDLSRSLRMGPGGGSITLGRAARALLLAEVALSCTALVGIGHGYRGMRGLVRSTLEAMPFSADAVAVARYDLLEDRHASADARVDLHRRILGTVRTDSRVRAAALGDAIPGTVYYLGARPRSVAVEGASLGLEARPGTRLMAVSPGYFDLVGAELLQGRDLSWDDRPERERVAVVNASFVRRHLGGVPPLGRRIQVGDEGEWRRIVGVVSDVAMRRPNGRADGVYLPFSEGEGSAWLLALPRGDALPLLPTLRAAVWAQDPLAPITASGTMRSVFMEAAGGGWLLMNTWALFALAALLITGIGLHGVIAFSVERRTRETAVRAAVGARPVSLVWQVLGILVAPVVYGSLLGLTVAWWLSPLLGVALLGADPRDPLLYILVPVALVGSAVIAGLGPLRRMLSMRIMDGLRVE